MIKTQYSTSLLVMAITAAALALFALFLPFLSGLTPSVLLAVGAVIGGGMVSVVTNKVSSARPIQVNNQTLYVGNLPYRANETSVRELFSQYGHVVSVRLLKDKHTGKRRGFGFVEMAEDGAAAAIKGLNDQEYQDRTLKVRPANERKERDPGIISND